MKTKENVFLAENAIKISFFHLDKAFLIGNRDDILSSFFLFVLADEFASVAECDGRERLKAAYRFEYELQIIVLIAFKSTPYTS